MIINQSGLLELSPIKDMENIKIRQHGVSYGLAEAGYDIRLKQAISFGTGPDHYIWHQVDEEEPKPGRFTLASAIEEFQMPDNLVGVVHDKSTWARKGLSVFNTVIEPGWKGFLTLELVYHGEGYLDLPAGCGIAQVLFTQISENNAYNGKYQNQENKPVAAKFET